MLQTSEDETVQTDPTLQPAASGRIRSAKQHNELEEFLRENNNALISYVYSWVRSRADAVDIVQEAYCRIFRLGDLRADLFWRQRRNEIEQELQMRAAFHQAQELLGGESTIGDVQ